MEWGESTQRRGNEAKKPLLTHYSSFVTKPWFYSGWQFTQLKYCFPQPTYPAASDGCLVLNSLITSSLLLQSLRYKFFHSGLLQTTKLKFTGSHKKIPESRTIGSHNQGWAGLGLTGWQWDVHKFVPPHKWDRQQARALSLPLPLFLLPAVNLDARIWNPAATLSHEATWRNDGSTSRQKTYPC